jgi:hypothetical protein
MAMTHEVAESGQRERPFSRASSLFLLFAQVSRLVGALLLILMSARALWWLVGHSSFVIDQETIAITRLFSFGDPGPATSTGPGDDVGTLDQSLIGPELPPALLLIACIALAILLVLIVVESWQKVIAIWVQAQSCTWSSFLTFLGCLLTWIWAVFVTILAVIITLFAIILVFYNIVAFVAAL